MIKYVCIKTFDRHSKEFLEGSIYILHTPLSEGGKYREVYDIEDNYISTLAINIIKENLILLSEWRESQIDLILND